MRKGQNLSINVIIVAAIALLVLVILAVLLLGSGKNLSEKKCNTVPGTCKEEWACDTEVDRSASDCPDGKVCCKIFQLEE